MEKGAIGEVKNNKKKYLFMTLCIITVFILSSCSKDIGQKKSIDDNPIDNTTESKNTKSASYKKIEDYLWKETKDTFSPYYELISYEITDYKEDAKDDTVEGVLNYKIIYKNYDKDPDTVGYIKEAKEKNDPNYKTYYDEYLQQKEMNMEIKAVIDKEGNITLYGDNDPTEKREWTELKMSDFIIDNK